MLPPQSFGIVRVTASVMVGIEHLPPVLPGRGAFEWANTEDRLSRASGFGFRL